MSESFITTDQPLSPPRERSDVAHGRTALGDEVDVAVSRPGRYEVDRLCDLAGGTAHELSNLLGALLMRVQLLQRLGEVNEPMSVHLDALEGLVRAGVEVVDALQRLGAVGRLRHAPDPTLDISGFLETMRSDLGAAAPSGVELTVRPSNHPLLVPLDGERAELVIRSLVSNAFDALLEQGPGRVVVSVRSNADPRRPLAMLTVSDDGPGLADVQADQADRPFVTTKRDRPGAGLGLTIVQTIARTAGGRLRLYPAGDAGTCAEVRLPLISP